MKVIDSGHEVVVYFVESEHRDALETACVVAYQPLWNRTIQ